jgi:hypothetical protein
MSGTTNDIHEFLSSWAKADEYPLNLIRLGSRHGALRAHKRLLDRNAPELFNPNSRVVAIDLNAKSDKYCARKCAHLRVSGRIG